MSDHFDPYHVWLGIPPEESAAGRLNHYRLLGLRLFETNPDVISNALDQRRAYLRSVQSGKRAAQSQQLLNEVSAAGLCLLDDTKKRRYDEELRRKLAPPPPTLAAAAAPIIPSAQLPPAAVPLPSPVAAPALPVVTRRRKAPSSSMVVAAVLIVSCAATLLLGAALGAWWALSHRRSAEIAVADNRLTGAKPAEVLTPSDAPTLPAELPTTATPSGSDSSAEKSPAVVRPVLHPPATGSQQRLALVFSGRESVQVPLPAEITAPGAEFTVELWAWWDRHEPAGRLLGASSLRVHCTALAEGSTPGGFNLIHLGAAGGGIFRRSSIQGGRWTHIAVVRGAENVDLFIHGSRSLRLKVTSDFAINSPLVLGDTAGAQNPAAPGFHGMIRDVRVSRGARYSEGFTPEEKFEVDNETRVLLDLTFPRQPNQPINNLAGGAPPAVVMGARWIPLTPQGELAGESPDGTVDLLRTLNVSLGTLEGDSFQTASHVETHVTHGRSRMLWPYRPPAEYDLELDITRLEGDGGAFVGLEIAGRPAIVAIADFPQYGRRTGLMPSDISGDLSDANRAPYLSSTPALLPTGERQGISVGVRLIGTSYKVTVARERSPLVEMNGEISSLQVPAAFAIPLAHGMSLGSIDAKIRFDRVLLRPVTKDFSPHVLASIPRVPPRGRPPGPAATGKTKTGPSSAAAASSASSAARPADVPAAGSRRRIPEGEMLTKAVEDARQIYESDFKSATKAAQKAALARRILETGKETQNDPTARYVLIDLARKVLIQAGEVQDAVAAARLLENEYEIPREELLATTIAALDDAQLATDERGELAKIAADAADAAADAEQYERAEKLSAIASQSAGKLRDADARKEMAQRHSHIVRLVKDWNAVKPSLDKLKEDPSDAAAHLAAGKFYCFTLDDFSRGVKHLADGSEALLADAAKKDIAAESGEAAKRFEAAAAWQLAAAKIADREDKLAVQRREKWLLQQAASGLTGLDQIKANKRLEELKDVGQARTKTAASSTRPSGRRTVSMIGRLVSGNNDLGLLISYEHGYLISSDDFARLLKAANITSPQNLKVGLIGAFSLPADQNVMLRHAGGSTTGGVHRLFIDNRIVSTVGDNRIKDDNRPIRLTAGTHLVRWELTGGDFGTALLELRSDPATTGGSSVPISLTIDRSIESAARQLPSRTTIHFGSPR